MLRPAQLRFAAVVFIACHSSPGEQREPVARSARPVSPRAPNGVPAVDGKHFAEEAMYKGECVYPAQGGGGCWSVRLFPDGRAEHMYVDVLVRERYEIDGSAVLLTTGKGVERLESKDAFLSIGPFRFMPPGETVETPAYIRE